MKERKPEQDEADRRRRTENVLKGDECYGPGCGTGSSLEPELSEAVSEDRRPRGGSYHDAWLSDVDSFERDARGLPVRVVTAPLVEGTGLLEKAAFPSWVDALGVGCWKHAQSVLRRGLILPALSHSLCVVSVLMIVSAPRFV